MNKQEKIMKKIPSWKKPMKEIIGPAVRDWFAQASLADKKKFCEDANAFAVGLSVSFGSERKE